MRPMLATRTKRKTRVHIGPADRGRAMSLDDFDRATVVDGFLHELAQGLIEVSEVPATEHGAQLHETKKQFYGFDAMTPGIIEYIAGGSDMKLMVRSHESERHPDLAIYTTPRPDVRGSDIWSLWIPTLVIEVVSETSRKRDYEEKPAEYLTLGVDEYWIIDAAKKCLVQHVRYAGEWRIKTLKSPKKVTSHFLPGLKFDLGRVIAAAKK
jgi:Uma2 family endonuclease